MPPAITGETRRSQRLLLVLPVTLIYDADGASVSDEAESEIISAHGALLRSRSPLKVRAVVTLLNERTKERIAARVIAAPYQGADGLRRVAVEFLRPSAAFWGISFPSFVATPSAPLILTLSV